MASSILHPYQVRWLDDASRFKIGMFARQTGKTFTTTLEIALDMVRAEIEGRRTRWVILSRGERQAQEAMDEGVKLHLRALDAAFKETSSPFRLSDRTVIRALDVSMRGGSRVTALPANPDTARGFSANVFLDEFAFHKDSAAIWKALFPVISKPGLKLRIVSTPNGKGNRFHDLMTGESSLWSRHTVDIYQAVAEGLVRDIDQLKEGCGDDLAWAQEFELQWIDESNVWLPLELIYGVEDADAGKPSLYRGGACVVGVDIGRRRDLFVACVFEEVGDVLWMREMVERKGATFAEQDAILDDLFKRYRIVRCCMDQTGMGEKPVEDAIRRHGSLVEGVLFTGTTKQHLATVSKTAFENRTLRIPKDCAPLRADLHKIQRMSTPTGAPRFVAESDAKGHADRAWSLFLAMHAGYTPRMDYGYTPVSETHATPFYAEDYQTGAW